MRAVRFHEHGGEEVLALEEVGRPEPGPDEVVVENKAIGINHIDTLYREGIFPPPEMPAIPGSDFAGVVFEVGDEVTDFNVGDRVHGAGLGGDRPGTYAEYVSAPVERIATLPDAVSFIDGAAMGHVGVAAWQAVIHHGDPAPGDICLIHGGGGGVGHIAVQLAANAGATVITTEAAEDTRERLATLGATETFDFRRDDLGEAILSVGEPHIIVDYFFDHYLEFDIEHVAHNGHISVLEFSTEVDGTATIPQSVLRAGILKDVTIQLVGIYNGDIANILNRMGAMCAAGNLSIEIAHEYSLEEAVKAHESLANEVHVGKLVFSL